MMSKLHAAALCLGLALAGPAGAQAYGETSALTGEACARVCLEKALDAYVSALAKKDPSAAPFADKVRFTENSVEMPVGEGLWDTVTSVVPDDGMKAADPETGNVAWFGHAFEHGKLI